jgi:hypothetical protein
MNVVIPPIVFYIVGSALIIGGFVRALTMGRRNPSKEIADDDPAKVRLRRRHLTFGILWIGAGLFLIGSTVMTLKSRAESSNPVRGSSSTIRLDPARPTTVAPPAAP